MHGEMDVSGIESRFVIGAVAGRGDYGEVFRATDRERNQPVAIKRLHNHMRDPITLERFEREARYLRRIESPHVVRYVAHGFDRQDRMCLVTEWLDGSDLASRQASRPLSLRESVDCVRQAALGVEALHHLGILHRDVKPSNLFLAALEPVNVKLLDLGISLGPSEPALTMTGAQVGTPAYMSPEQVCGQDALTPGADVYALGVVLYELLAGQRPFDRSRKINPALIVLEQPVPLHRYAPAVQPGLEAIVMAAIAKDPGERFLSAGEMADALAPWVHS